MLRQGGPELGRVGRQHACLHADRFFSLPETDIAIERVFDSFAHRTADPKLLGEWLQGVLNEDSRFKATAEGTWSAVIDILDQADIWRDAMWGWYTIIDVTDVEEILGKKSFFK